MFKEPGTISWRKIMTCAVLICMVTAQLGYLITHNFNELPMSYQAIDAGVFAFYFGKKFIEGVKVVKS